MREARLVPSVDSDPHEFDGLRSEVREFIDEEFASGAISSSTDSWLAAWDEGFSRRLAARGWIGMTIPKEYCGRERGFMERFVVTEELLAAGAPVAAHWIADRQIAPSLLKFGSEYQKKHLLPGIAAGTIYFAIGMSEPDSGSDLASVRTKAVKVDGGWRLTGTKVWTSGAHRSHYMICLARSEPLDVSNRHGGLSQFILDLHTDGVTVSPIVSMNGARHFNEVALNEVFVPDEMLFGVEGQGWRQVTSELAFERSGPERFLSTFPVLAAATATEAGQASDLLGHNIARVAALHQMSMAVAGALSREEQADVAAAVVKVLGTTTEGDIVDELDLVLGDDSPTESSATELSRSVAIAADQRPGFTLRGGTNEILRGVIARGLGMR